MALFNFRLFLSSIRHEELYSQMYNIHIHTAASGNWTPQMQPYPDGHADKPEVTSSAESLEGCVLDSCNWSSQWISVDNDGDWASSYCSAALCYMGMRTAGKLAFIFCIITPALLPSGAHAHTPTPTPTHTRTHTHTHTPALMHTFTF